EHVEARAVGSAHRDGHAAPGPATKPAAQEPSPHELWAGATGATATATGPAAPATAPAAAATAPAANAQAAEAFAGMYDAHAKPARGVASLETVPLSGGWQVLRSFGVPKYDDLVARLVGRDGALEQEWAVLMRDGAKYASPGQYVGPGTEQEIAANVSDRGGEKAAILPLGGNQPGVLQPMIVMLKESVALLPRKIDAAQGRLASLRDRQGVQKLQKELDERKATAARTAKSLELLAKMILEP